MFMHFKQLFFVKNVEAQQLSSPPLEYPNRQILIDLMAKNQKNTIFVTSNRTDNMKMSKMRLILVAAIACFTLALAAQDTEEVEAPAEWYLDEIVSEGFVRDCSFEFYYKPSASDMKQQRAKGEVAYFLNTPSGLNRKKACALIDNIMACYDGIIAMNDWQDASTVFWKDFRYEKNKFHVSVKSKALDDGTYYVSVTESANHFKSLPKAKQEEKKKEENGKKSARTKRASRSDRQPVIVPEQSQDVEEVATEDTTEEQETVEEDQEPQQDEKSELEAAKRLEREKQREQARAEKEAEKLRKAEEKKARQEQEALKKEQEKLRKEQEKQLKEEERQRQAAEKQQQALARQQQKAERERQAAYAASKYHYSDVALWLSDKYDYTQTAAGENAITMYSLAVKDVEMAKLTIKNALKGSNARMAMPWRVNSQDGTIETGYSVDGHMLVFAIGHNDAGNITLSITEMDNDQFELFKEGGLL